MTASSYAAVSIRRLDRAVESLSAFKSKYAHYARLVRVHGSAVSLVDVDSVVRDVIGLLRAGRYDMAYRRLSSIEPRVRMATPDVMSAYSEAVAEIKALL